MATSFLPVWGYMISPRFLTRYKASRSAAEKHIATRAASDSCRPLLCQFKHDRTVLYGFLMTVFGSTIADKELLRYSTDGLLCYIRICREYRYRGGDKESALMLLYNDRDKPANVSKGGIEAYLDTLERTYTLMDNEHDLRIAPQDKYRHLKKMLIQGDITEATYLQMVDKCDSHGSKSYRHAVAWLRKRAAQIDHLAKTSSRRSQHSRAQLALQHDTDGFPQDKIAQLLTTHMVNNLSRADLNIPKPLWQFIRDKDPQVLDRIMELKRQCLEDDKSRSNSTTTGNTPATGSTSSSLPSQYPGGFKGGSQARVNRLSAGHDSPSDDQPSAQTDTYDDEKTREDVIHDTICDFVDEHGHVAMCT